MGVSRKENGFTVIEMVVTLIVLALFLTLFFQLYATSESQRLAVLRRAAANDIAMTNLKKISVKTLIPSGQSCANGGGTIATNVSGQNPTWTAASLNAEPISGTSLPNDTTQTVAASYPYGCSAAMPAKITSTVSYSSGSETVTRETYIN